MTLEIRTITADEIEAAETIAAEAFGGNRRDMTAAVERSRRFFQPDWTLAAFEDGQMASMMRMLPFAMRINGRAIPFGAVGPVANSPLHRRKGHTGALLRQSLALMRDRGQWLSGLYTPHPAFYRRYGWEISADERRYSFKPKDYRPTVEAAERGRLRYIEPPDWHQLDRIYRQHSTMRNGPLHRGEVWWRNSILNEAATAPQAPNEAVIWETSAGQPEGYCVFVQPTQGPEAGKVLTRELAALTSDAYLNLMSFLAMHDIHREIVHQGPSDDPLPLIFADTERLDVRQEYTALLRLVDVEAALKSRPPASAEVDAELTLEVVDGSARWNEGTFRLQASEGSVQVERVGGGGDIKVDARVLAPVFNGYLSPSMAAVTGQMRVEKPEALAQAEAFFAVAHRPYFPDRF